MEKVPDKKVFDIFEYGRIGPFRISISVEENSLTFQRWIIDDAGSSKKFQEQFQFNAGCLPKLIEVLQQAKLFVDEMKVEMEEEGKADKNKS